MPAATPTRKHLAWRTWLDMPVGLTLRSPVTPGAVHLREPGLAHDVPRPPGVVPGWLVLLGISNRSWRAVRGSDFAAPLAFSLPGGR